MNDLVINKIQSIQRCIQRAREEYHKNPSKFDTDYTSQDAAILNILRACEQCIDLANHLIRRNKLGIPSSSAESFELLARRGIISAGLSESLQKMVAFRNTVIHDYKKTDIAIVKIVLENGLDDLIAFTDSIIRYMQE